MAIADVLAQPVLLDHIAHVFADLVGGRDRRAHPRLETVAKGIQIAVGPNARILMRPPGAAKRLLRLQHHKRRARILLGQVIRPAHAGNPGADDQHVEMLNPLRRRTIGERCGIVHLVRSSTVDLGAARIQGTYTAVARSRKAIQRERKNLLFLKKKKQKDFHPLGPAYEIGTQPMDKSFLVLFFKKERLPYIPPG